MQRNRTLRLITMLGMAVLSAAAWPGAGRAKLREGGGRGTGDDHFFELDGSSRITVFIPPGNKMKGYREFKERMEADGCQVVYPAPSNELPNARYTAVNITCDGKVISSTSLKRAHRWAHQRNLLHSFFRPLFAPKG